MEQLADDVRAVVAAELMVEPAAVTDSLGPGEIARWDSIAHLQIIRAIERRFGVSFTVVDVMASTTVGDLILTVSGHLEGKTAR